MSIRDEIKAGIVRGELFNLVQTIPSDPCVRRVIVSKNINECLAKTWGTDAEAEPWANLQADLEAFVCGAPVTIAKNPRRARTAFMAKLTDEKGRIWELRERAPKPGMRLIGGFAEKDLLVLLSWSLRIELNEYGSPQWHAFINNCKAEWRRLFLTWPPITSDNDNDYLSAPTLLI